MHDNTLCTSQFVIVRSFPYVLSEFQSSFIMSSLNFLEAKLIMTSVLNDICGFTRMQHLSDSSVELAMLIAKRLNMITVLTTSSGYVFLLNAQPFSRSESES